MRFFTSLGISLLFSIVPILYALQCPIRTQYERIIQWNLARASIGMNMTQFNEKTAHRIYTFYNFHSGIALFNASSRPLAYVNVYKCASNAIRSNIRRQTRRIRGIESNHANIFTSMDTFKQVLSKFGAVPLFTFSFVRHPLSHFEAGLREYIYRCGTKCAASHDEAVSASTLIRVIVDLLSFSSRSEIDIPHVFPMAGAMSTFGIKPTYIGKIENFDENWSELQTMAHLPPHHFNSTIIRHRSTALGTDMKKSFATLMEMDNYRYLRALCYLLYDDFVCFNYTLPAPCAGIDSTAFQVPRRGQRAFLQAHGILPVTPTRGTGEDYMRSGYVRMRLKHMKEKRRNATVIAG